MSNQLVQSETEHHKAQSQIQTSQHQAMLALEKNQYKQRVGRIKAEHLRNITFMEELRVRKVKKKKLPDSKLATKKQWTAGKRNRKPPLKMRMTSTRKNSQYLRATRTELIKDFEEEDLDHEESNKARIEKVEKEGRECFSELQSTHELRMAKLEKAHKESMGHQ
ncbi:hypothetical protein BELL_0308g00120 [Botrytis elliptica]|uniref:Uncharacterized protein n=1 Tax=Botrytis elliptica TaxID=278938 RepID=A0A4Z1JKC2_9HELO|nr:hypothetical protein EAE99_010205 [Botrytis elliptica]TGO74105.1 hypothetical protein BELL_0308g00120 [Botrytis elliptica]